MPWAIKTCFTANRVSKKKIFCMRSYPTSSGRCLFGPSRARVCVKSLNTGKQSINGDDLVRAFILKPNAPCVFSNTRCIIIVYTDANAPRVVGSPSGTSSMHTDVYSWNIHIYICTHRHIIIIICRPSGPISSYTILPLYLTEYDSTDIGKHWRWTKSHKPSYHMMVENGLNRNHVRS